MPPWGSRRRDSGRALQGTTPSLSASSPRNSRMAAAALANSAVAGDRTRAPARPGSSKPAHGSPDDLTPRLGTSRSEPLGATAHGRGSTRAVHRDVAAAVAIHRRRPSAPVPMRESRHRHLQPAAGLVVVWPSCPPTPSRSSSSAVTNHAKRPRPVAEPLVCPAPLRDGRASFPPRPPAGARPAVTSIAPPWSSTHASPHALTFNAVWQRLPSPARATQPARPGSRARRRPRLVPAAGAARRSRRGASPRATLLPEPDPGKSRRSRDHERVVGTPALGQRRTAARRRVGGKDGPHRRSGRSRSRGRAWSGGSTSTATTRPTARDTAASTAPCSSTRSSPTDTGSAS